VAAELEEARVPGEGGGACVSHQHLGVVDQEPPWRTAEVGEAGLQGGEDRSLGLVQAGEIELAAAIAEDEPEDDDPAGRVAEPNPIGRPVELPLFPRPGLVAHHRAALAARCFQGGEMRVEGRLPAPIAQATQLPQDPRADELLLDEHRGDLRGERGQLRVRARRAGVLRGVVGPERRPHRVPRQPQLHGDAADAQPLGV